MGTGLGVGIGVGAGIGVGVGEGEGLGTGVGMVGVGGGDGIGAPVLMDDHVFIDTSRVGGHYTKAIMLASALVDIKNEKMRKKRGD